MANSTEQQEPLGRTLAGGSYIVFDYTCQPCSGDNKTLEAVGFCVDCSKFLCEDCFKHHLKPTLTRNHTLLDIDEFKKNKDVARYQDVCTEKCPQHPREIVRYFCSDHDVLGCGACMTVDHRNCPGVKYIPDIAEDMANGNKYAGLMGELDSVLLRTKLLIISATENKAKSQSHCEKILTDMEQIKKELMAALEKLVKTMQAKAKKMKLKDTQKMDANIAVFDNIQHKADTLAVKLKSMKDNGQYCKLFSAMMTEKCDITSLDVTLDKAANDNTVDNYIFQPSTQLEELMKYKDSLGKLTQQDQVISNAMQVGKIRMRTDSDSETCSILGIATLSSGRLVATDFNNKKIKLVDVGQAKVISEIGLSNWPRDITVTDEINEIAVTLPSRYNILLVKVSGDTLLKHRKIKTSNCCYGVASVMDNLVDRGTIYVPDSNEHTVTCLSLSGKVKAVYKDKDLKVARCVAVDGRGNVYVGGRDSKNIHQITQDCRKISILLSQKDGVGMIRALCYSTETDCLYVGQEKDTILTFQLS